MSEPCVERRPPSRRVQFDEDGHLDGRERLGGRERLDRYSDCVAPVFVPSLP